MKLLIASSNRGKVTEFAELLTGLQFTLLGLKDVPDAPDVEETGTTFEDNAILKASEYAAYSGYWTLADDSGLEVEALGGRPGVLSARFGGEGISFTEKIDLLLAELAELAEAKDALRRARFVCAIAIADERGEIKYSAEGRCEGSIAARPRGVNGFGYDPIFVPDGFTETFGELSADIKGQISHRARATAKIIRYLRDFTGD